MYRVFDTSQSIAFFSSHIADQSCDSPSVIKTIWFNNDNDIHTVVGCGSTSLKSGKSMFIEDLPAWYTAWINSRKPLSRTILNGRLSNKTKLT